MSPAKRLSRKRFRALCERCAKWEWDVRSGNSDACKRTRQFIRELEWTHLLRGTHRPYVAAMTAVHALARLAR